VVEMKKDGINVVFRDLLLIAKFLAQKKEITTYQFARNNFEWENSYELQKIDVFVRKFLKKYEKYGIFKSEVVDGRTIYKLDSKKIRANPVVIDGKRLVSIGICINGKWLCCTL
jgi:glycerophosphoryl diester phosphodiesterase